MKLAVLLLAPALLVAEECEQSTLLQKNLAALKELKENGVDTKEGIPGFMAQMGLNMAVTTLQDAADAVDAEVKSSKKSLGKSLSGKFNVNACTKDSNKKLSHVFSALQSELEKGVKTVKAGLSTVGLSSSLTQLQDAMDTATSLVKDMKSACKLPVPPQDSDVAACQEAGETGHTKLTNTFEEWISSAANELLTKVSSSDKASMRKYNKQKVPETTKIVDDMGQGVQKLIDGIAKNLS
ncbi:unnamed protein product [Durusdinium trenchii]|uniref:Uncharacterized protein n=1 Tax=Durusdinium trenchii TaxID=1381693 RepID=A0ABP0SN55_9DINO